ncbi:MAG: hypothetical protein WCZ12_01280 [Patescibacteria group bacterium]
METLKKLEKESIDFLQGEKLPFIPSGLSSISSHNIDKGLSFNFSKMELYSSELQKNPITNKAFGGRIINSEIIRKGKKMYNASFLDFIFANPEIFPKKMYEKYIFFAGTIYLDPYGNECVRCLYFDEIGIPSHNYFWLDFPFSENYYFLIEKE